MTTDKIGRILAAHRVPYQIIGCRIYADSMIGGTDPMEQVEDMTGWSLRQLLHWLGY